MRRSRLRSAPIDSCFVTTVRARLPAAVLATALLSAGCGSGGSGTSSSTSGGGTGGIQTGGILKVATEPATNRDPAFASARADILINQQVYDWLVEIGQNNELLPGLATGWESADGKVWTFTLRSDVKFSNGTPFTADDVVYTFDRLRDPEVGSPGVSLYANVTAIEAVDATHVRFTLKDANPEFPSDVADYHAAVLSRGVKDPAAEWVGTGPFTIASYSAENQAILKKNPGYWMKDDQGRQLPYLDEIQFIFSPDAAGQVEALRGDQVQFVAGLTSELVDSIKTDAKLKVITGPASAFHYVIHMRSDAGRPAADPRVRKALQLGTDHQGLIDQVRPGLAVVGNGTPVGPAYGDYYLDQAPVFDPAQAKKLLADAGIRQWPDHHSLRSAGAGGPGDRHRLEGADEGHRGDGRHPNAYPPTCTTARATPAGSRWTSASPNGAPGPLPTPTSTPPT